jgi:hypothetical protein
MAKVTVRGAREMAEHIQAALEQVARPENMRKYAEMASDMVRLRTRLGSGVDADGANKSRLKPLADSTIEERKRLKSRGELSADTSPGRSNLTRTGELLDSIQPTQVSQGSAKIGPDGIRSDGLSNQKVAEYVTAQGRAFNNLSSVELKRIHDAVKRDVRDIIKRLLTTPK